MTYREVRKATKEIIEISTSQEDMKVGDIDKFRGLQIGGLVLFLRLAGARHDKSKEEKKKNKDSRKTKDVKTIANNELHMRPKEIGEFNSSVSLKCDEGHLYHGL
ncbi:hypothetical protein AgCh_026098 [Apium graveolens]